MLTQSNLAQLGRHLPIAVQTLQRLVTLGRWPLTSPLRRRLGYGDWKVAACRQGDGSGWGIGGGKATAAAQVPGGGKAAVAAWELGDVGGQTAGGGATMAVGHQGTWGLCDLRATSSRSPTMSEPDGTTPAQTLGKFPFPCSSPLFFFYSNDWAINPCDELTCVDDRSLDKWWESVLCYLLIYLLQEQK